MKIIIIYLVVLVAIVIYSANFNIQFYPFKVSADKPYFAIGLLLLVISLALFQYQSFEDGKKAGIQYIFDLSDKLKKDNDTIGK